jgi:hypothetical protein
MRVIKNIAKKSKILFFLIFSFFYFIEGQDLKLFTPIIISNLSNGIANDEKVNKVVLDYYNPDPNEMNINLLKYSSDDDTVYLFDTEHNKFKLFLNFKNPGKLTSSENFLGVFRYFNLTQKSEKCFTVSSASGNYPSHIEKIRSIEILEKSKKYIILKVNYSDIYDFNGYGVLVLQDYTK